MRRNYEILSLLDTLTKLGGTSLSLDDVCDTGDLDMCENAHFVLDIRRPRSPWADEDLSLSAPICRSIRSIQHFFDV